MARIPIGATIARSYRFAFGNFLNNLGAIWISLAILYGLMLIFRQSYMTAMTTAAVPDPEQVQRILPFFFVAFIVIYVLLIAQIAALTREALGLRVGSAWLQFPFGAGMWRLLLAHIALVFVMIILYIATLLGAALFGVISTLLLKSLAPGIGKIVLGIAVVVLIVAIFCWFIFCIVRLSFLIAPIAMVEGKRTLRRSWELTQGNFWRIFLVLLSVLVPFMVVELCYLHFVLGPYFFPPPDVIHSQQALAEWQRHQQLIVRQSMVTMQSYWYIAYPLGVIFDAVLYGLFAALSAFSYEALVPKTSETVDIAATG